MFHLEFRDTARRQINKLARKNPNIVRDIKEKIQWLVSNADNIDHEKMHGHSESSLHSGQYRILYSIDRANRKIIIEDIDKHDAAYRKLNRR